MNLLELHDIHFTTSERTILSGVTLAIASGEVHARLGICMAWQEPARFEGLRVHDYLSLGAP